MAINTKTFHPIEDTCRITQINFNYSNAIGAKISQVVKPILNTIKTISAQHLGSSTYLLINEEDMIAKKVLKVSSWILGISPTILLGIYLYDRLLDLYHEHFENYSRMEDYSDETSENLQSSIVQLPKEQPKIEPLLAQTLPKILEPSVSFTPDDTPNAPGHTDVDSDLGEGESESVFEEPVTANFTSSKSMLKPEIEDCPEEEQPRDLQADSLHFRNQQFAESRGSSHEIFNPMPDSLEDGFEQVNMTPELLEEMKNSPEMPSPRGGVTRRIMEIARGLHGFLVNNPFFSNKSKVTNPLPSELEHKELHYEDLKMLHPIIEVYKNSKIPSTEESIGQIKMDLPRMEIFINGIRCSNIQEYTSRLGFTLNENETDILEKDNPIVSKLLNLVQQRSLNFSHNVLANHWRHLNVMPMMAHIQNTKPIVRVNYTAESPLQCEITGETLFTLLEMNEDGTARGLLPYICKVETKCSLDTVEVSWELMDKPSQEESSSPRVAISEHVDESVPPEEEEFEELEAPLENTSNVNNNLHIAFNHLLNNPNDCLNSTVTSEYLKSLKIKDSTFVYEDRLMLPGSLTIEDIVKLLNKLKDDNPTNERIFLPFLVNGWTVAHAVVAVINLADETIEYFDPKGQSSLWFTRTEKQTNKNVFDFLTELGQKLISPTFSREKIVYNTKHVPQGVLDNINCGAFCLQFIEARMNLSFNNIEKKPLLPVDPKELRLQLADRLVKNTHSNAI